jgi:hypothetical protein
MGTRIVSRATAMKIDNAIWNGFYALIGILTIMTIAKVVSITSNWIGL